ncbi:MAG: hypothetical protein K8W52_06270 [Deltaproteobacteria bacterium]|nr:hypothetical protein [Deltaproteobacteria bacterium]
MWDLLGAHEGRIEDIITAGDAAIAASGDGTVALWPPDGSAPRVLASFRKQAALSLALDDRDLVIGTSEAVYRLALGAPAAPRRVLDAAAQDCIAVGVAVHGGTIAVALHDEANGSDHPITVLERDGRTRWSTTVRYWPYGIQFSPDGREVVVNSWDGKLYRFDAATGDEHDETPWIAAALVDAAWVGPAELAVASLDGTLGVWDLARGALVDQLPNDDGWTAVAVTGDRGLLAAGDNRGGLVIRQHAAHHTGASLDAAARPDLERPWASARQATMFPSNGEFKAIGGDRVITALAFHPRAWRLFAGFHDGAVACLELET